MAETEHRLVCETLDGDARAYRELYDLAFRVAWAFAVRGTGEARLAEEVTARALRRVFAALPALRAGSPALGAFVLRFAEEALRELATGPATAPPHAAAAGK